MGNPEKQTQYKVLFRWSHSGLQMAANKAKNHNIQEVQHEKVQYVPLFYRPNYCP